MERELRPHAHGLPPRRSDCRRLGRAAVPGSPARTHLCTPPWPYIPYQQLRSVAQRPKSEISVASAPGASADAASSGSRSSYQPPGSKPSLGGDQVAYDAVTHQPVALRTIERGGRFNGMDVQLQLARRSCRTSRGKECRIRGTQRRSRSQPAEHPRPSSPAGSSLPRLAPRSARPRSGSAARSRAPPDSARVVVGTRGEVTRSLCPGECCGRRASHVLTTATSRSKSSAQDRPPWYLSRIRLPGRS